MIVLNQSKGIRNAAKMMTATMRNMANSAISIRDAIRLNDLLALLSKELINRFKLFWGKLNEYELLARLD